MNDPRMVEKLTDEMVRKVMGENYLTYRTCMWLGERRIMVPVGERDESIEGKARWEMRNARARGLFKK